LFLEDIALVRHPAIGRLIAQDEVRRQKQAAATYAFSGRPGFWQSV
jgi:hypothetical protein